MKRRSAFISTFGCVLQLVGNLRLSTINLGHVAHKVNNTVGISPLVVVPGNELHESRVEHDACLGVEDGGDGASNEVLGDKGLVGVAHDALHVAVGAALDLSADLLVGGVLGKSAGEVNNGDIGGGHTEGHSSDLALKGGDDRSDGLGSTGGGGDDVGRSASSSSPVFLGGAVDNHLGGGHGVNGGHESLLNAEGVVDHLDHGGEAVGGAGRAGHVSHVGLVIVGVDSHDDGGGLVLGGGGEDDLLHAGLDVGLAGLGGEEGAGGLAEVLHSEVLPWDLLRLAGVGGLDTLAVDDEVLAVHLQRALPSAVNGVVFELVGHVVGVSSGVDSLEAGPRVLDHDTGHKTTDTSESVDTESIAHLKGRGRSHSSGRGEGISHGDDEDEGDGRVHHLEGGKVSGGRCGGYA